MRLRDQLRFATQSLAAARWRTVWIVLAMAIGTAGVVLLTWLGESGRRYVTDQFASLGTNLVIVLPGRNETTGGAPPILGETPRDLTLEDALALLRSSAVARVAPVQAGSITVARGSRSREAMVLGSTAALQEVRHLHLQAGVFLPPGDPRRSTPVCVLGAKLRQELFGAARALGEWVRLGGRRFRVIGILADEGRSLGTDLQDVVLVPVAASQQLFDREGMFRVLVQAPSREAIPTTVRHVERTIAARHDGENDVTVITQESVLQTFDGILRALTLAVAGIAAISLVVAGILILNVMVIAVSQRRGEIGLLKALGTTPAVIRQLFLWEAALLSLLGAGAGIAGSEGLSRLLAHFVPELTAGTPGWAAGAALGTALVLGIGFGTGPARRAARLDPVAALARR